MLCASYHIISWHISLLYIYFHLLLLSLSILCQKYCLAGLRRDNSNRRDATQSSEEQLRFLSHSCRCPRSQHTAISWKREREEEEEEMKRRNILRQHSTGTGYILYLQCTHDVLQNTPQVILLWKCVYTVGNGWKVREGTPSRLSYQFAVIPI